MHPAPAAAFIREALAREPFTPFSIEVADGRRIEVRRRGDAVLNSLAVSVCEAPFSVTVIGLDQVRAVDGRLVFGT